MKIAEIKHGMKGIDIPIATVISIGETRNVNTKYITGALVKDLIIKDDSGQITFSIWNNNINKISRAGVKIKIKNCYAPYNPIRDILILDTGRYGTIDVIPSTSTPTETPNTNNTTPIPNLSNSNKSDIYDNEIYPQYDSNFKQQITNDEDLKLLLKETEKNPDEHPKLPHIEKCNLFVSNFRTNQFSVETAAFDMGDNSYEIEINDLKTDKDVSIINLNQPLIDDSIITQHKTTTINSGNKPTHTKINPRLFENIDGFNSLGYYLRWKRKDSDLLTDLIWSNKAHDANSAGQKIALVMIANIAIHFRQKLHPTYYFPWLSSNIKRKDGIKETLIIPIPDDEPRCAPAIASHFHSILTSHQIWTDIIYRDYEDERWLIDRGITTEIRPDTNIDWYKFYNEGDEGDKVGFSNKLEEIINFRKSMENIQYNDKLLVKIHSDKRYGTEPYQEKFDRLIDIYRNNPEKIFKPLTSQQQKSMEHTNVVLIDDVVTQGGTTSAYAHIIKEEYKPKNIYVYSASVTRSG